MLDAAGAPDLRRSVSGWRLGCAIVLLAILMQAFGHFNGDNSWFITFAEKVLAGARPYVDIGDPNPPAAFLIYTPAILFARLTGVRVEAAVVLEILIAVGCCLAIIGALVRTAAPTFAPEASEAASFSAEASETAWTLGLLRNAALWTLLVAPGFGFAEREHFALIACLPMIVIFALRADGLSVSPTLAALAGAGGAMAVSFKPYYLAGIGGAALASVIRRRSLRPLFGLESFAAIFMGALYLYWIWRRYPDFYSGMAPLAIDVYAPARENLGDVLASAPFLFNACILAAIAAVSLKLRAYSSVIVLWAGSAGFLATYVVQAKNWFNHGYPGIALGVLAAVLLWALARQRAPTKADKFGRMGVLPMILCAPFFAAVTMLVPGSEEYPGLTAAVRNIAPAHPKIAALAFQLDVGHPLTRQLDGVWIGRQNALWIHNCVVQILATRTVDATMKAKLEAYDQRDQQDFAEDVRIGAPDILLVQSAAVRRWAERQPALKSIFQSFTLSGQADSVEIWVRSAP